MSRRSKFILDDYIGNVIKKVARRQGNKVADIEGLLYRDRHIQKREKDEHKRIKKVADIDELLYRDRLIQKREKKDQKRIKLLNQMMILLIESVNIIMFL